MSECATRDHLPVRNLLTSSDSISPDTRAAVLAERFYAEPELDALPLVKDGYPCGLASRGKILTTLAIRFGFALYGKEPISAIADMNPLIVHWDDTLEEVLSRAMVREFHDIYDEILVVDDEKKYVGRLSVKRLVVEQGNLLAQSIAQRELAMSKAAEIEKLNAMKSGFMAHVTHELRSPIHAIVGMTELMAVKFSRQQLDEFPKYLSLLTTSSLNLRTLVNDILDLAKIEAGRMEVFEEDFILGELLEEVFETCKLLAGSKPLAIEIDCAAPIGSRSGRFCSIWRAMPSNTVIAASSSLRLSWMNGSIFPSRAPGSASRRRTWRGCSTPSVNLRTPKPAVMKGPDWGLPSPSNWFDCWTARSMSTAPMVSAVGSMFGSPVRPVSRSRRRVK